MGPGASCYDAMHAMHRGMLNLGDGRQTVRYTGFFDTENRC